jgi:DNA-directed RNA polymerase subunit alpha
MIIKDGGKLINTRNWSELVKPEQLVRDAKSDGQYGKFICEPLERGFGTTIGNSLRRVLLVIPPGGGHRRREDRGRSA